MDCSQCASFVNICFMCNTISHGSKNMTAVLLSAVDTIVIIIHLQIVYSFGSLLNTLLCSMEIAGNETEHAAFKNTTVDKVESGWNGEYSIGALFFNNL